MFPYILPSIYMSVSFYGFITKQVMDFHKELSMWLEDATLFSNSAKSDDTSLTSGLEDFIVDNEDVKTVVNQSAFLDFNDVSGIIEGDGWLDEKIDLSIFDAMQDWLPPEENNTEKWIDESLVKMRSSEEPDIYLNSPIKLNYDEKDEEFHIGSQPEINIFASGSSSPADSLPVDIGLQLPSSPGDCYSITSHSSNIHSPLTSEDDEPSSDQPNRVDSPTSDDITSNVICFEIVPEIDCYLKSKSSESIQPSGKDLSVLRKSQKARHKPYSTSNRKEVKRERKKVQNKEAAARYRSKKREQDKVLAGDIASLEATKAQLQTKHDKLKSEVTYLKSLMKELFKARGLLK